MDLLDKIILLSKRKKHQKELELEFTATLSIFPSKSVEEQLDEMDRIRQARIRYAEKFFRTNPNEKELEY